MIYLCNVSVLCVWSHSVPEVRNKLSTKRKDSTRYSTSRATHSDAEQDIHKFGQYSILLYLATVIKQPSATSTHDTDISKLSFATIIKEQSTLSTCDQGVRGTPWCDTDWSYVWLTVISDGDVSSVDPLWHVIRVVRWCMWSPVSSTWSRHTASRLPRWRRRVISPHLPRCCPR